MEGPQVSARYRDSVAQVPEPSSKCQVVTGATMSGMNRDCSTRDLGQAMGRPWATRLNGDLRTAPEIAVYQHFSRADDGIRTRDPHLGKVMLYQLSHVRVVLTD